MESLSPSSPEAVLDDIVTALRRGDGARAERALAAAPEPPAAHAMLRLAELNMRRRRWQDAAWLFDHVPSRETSAELKRCLCRNLACLERHRPAVYALLVNLPAGERYSVGLGAGQRPTVVCRRDDGAQTSLSPGNDPLGGMNTALRALRPYLDKGQAIALGGVGDGYVLNALSRDTTPLVLGMQQPVFVLETDAHVLLTCLMIHDCTGPAGPIEQERFFWFIGPDCVRELQAAALNDPYLGCPVISIPLGLTGRSMAEQLQQAVVAVVQADDESAASVAAFHADTDVADLAELLGPNPPRQPRVLLLTTRFSTVLQYSTRDAADGFRQLGWEARVVIEPTAAHRAYRSAIRRALDELKPDMVFQIDHLRHEHGDMFPKSLPFACWAQDHLPNLTSSAAGAEVGPRDFVLVGMPTMYTGRWGYPARQCLALTKLTRVPRRPDDWESDGEDLIYVSTASQLPENVASDVVARYVQSPAACGLVAECCRRLILAYAGGSSYPTHHSVRMFVEEVERSVDLAIEAPDARRELIDVLFDRLGNLLYRQQSLGWAADISRKHGLKFGIYGPGWDKHPQLAEFARGRVEYGAQLEALTRRSRINLSVEPFFCKSHQRMLDGLVAGGFFLVRDNPFNTLMPELSRFLLRHSPPDAATVDDVRDWLASEYHGAFDELLGRCACLSEFGDPVEFVRNGQQAGTLDDEDEALPFLRDVSFASSGEMEAKVLEFLADAPRRREITLAQGRNVEQRLSYSAGLRRCIAEIRDLLLSEASLSHQSIALREAA